MDAIDARDWDGLADEGWAILLPVFFSQMAKEAGHFDVTDANSGDQQQADPPSSACIRRWTQTSDEVLRKWDEIKAGEKAAGQNPKDCSQAFPATSLP